MSTQTDGTIVEPTPQESTPQESAPQEPTPQLVAVPKGAPVRLPDLDDFAEQYLFHANEANRAFSEQQLRLLLPDLRTAGDGPTGVQPVDLRRLQRLFDLDLLDQLLDHGADPARVAISNWRFLGDVTNAAIDSNEHVHSVVAGRAIGDGGRVTLTGIERTTPGLRRLAEHIGRMWRARVTIAAAVGTGAFSGQPDVVLAYDHILLPVAGHRHVVATLPDGSTLHAGPVGPGDVLHVPAGASISTTAINEMFVHLEVRVARPLPLSLLPMIGDLSVPQQVEWPERDSTMRERLVAQWCAGLPTRPGTRFSSVTGSPVSGRFSDGWVRSTITGGWCPIAADDDLSPTLFVVAAGTGISIPEELLTVVADLLSGPPRRVSEVVAASPPAQRLVELLVVAGLMEYFDTEQADDTWDAVDIEPEGGEDAV